MVERNCDENSHVCCATGERNDSNSNSITLFNTIKYLKSSLSRFPSTSCLLLLLLHKNKTFLCPASFSFSCVDGLEHSDELTLLFFFTFSITTTTTTTMTTENNDDDDGNLLEYIPRIFLMMERKICLYCCATHT